MCLGGLNACSALGRFAAPSPYLWVIVCANKHYINGYPQVPSMIFTHKMEQKSLLPKD